MSFGWKVKNNPVSITVRLAEPSPGQVYFVCVHFRATICVRRIGAWRKVLKALVPSVLYGCTFFQLSSPFFGPVGFDWWLEVWAEWEFWKGDHWDDDSYHHVRRARIEESYEGVEVFLLYCLSSGQVSMIWINFLLIINYYMKNPGCTSEAVFGIILDLVLAIP